MAWLKRDQECNWCGNTFRWKCKKICCSEECKESTLAARRKVVILPCAGCGTEVKLQGKQLRQAHTGRPYCSDGCRESVVSKISSATMAKTNRRHASDRMKKNNPMHRQESREKMASTLREIGHKPPIQGGNGNGPTEPEQRLSDALGWPMQVIVKTGKKRGSGYPFHYKVDVGNPELKIAIEVDGGSHGTLRRRAQDEKKDALLRSLGWQVLRFSNREVMADSEACARMVMSTISRSKKPTTTLRMGS